MASTYSPSLRIELIGTGDQSGLWGETTNTNLGGLIEQAITGYQSIAMTDNDYTLTALNGSVDQARNAVLRFTSIGSLSATRSVIIPAVEKTYIIKNDTTGSQSITVKTSSGTGVTVIAGGTTHVYCDGTNVYQASQYFPSLSVGSIVFNSGTTGTGNIVLQTNPSIASPTISTPTITNQVSTGGSLAGVTISTSTISSLAAPLAVLYGGTGVSTSTGTGSVVLNNAPSLTSPTLTTPVLGTPSSGTLTNCTNLPIIGGTTGTLTVARGGTGVTTTQAAMNAFAGAVTSGQYLRGNGTNVVMSAIQAADVPTLNQNTTGQAGSVANSVTFNTSGTGDASGTAFNGAAARTISYNTVGAPSTTGTNASGTWNINISGSATTAGYITNASYNGYGLRTVSSSNPSGGNNGDIWYKV